MSSLELQQARGAHQALELEPEQKKPNMNGEANTISKPPGKPQKGIMRMFANKAPPKAQESTRDIKSEQEEASQVLICVIRYTFKQRNDSLIKFIKSIFQVEPVQTKAAGKANPVANFFRVQTSSE